MYNPTIHVVTEYQPWSNLESYWKECFYDSDFSGYGVNIIDGTLLRKESLLWGDTIYKTSQLKIIVDMVHNNEIKNGDIFVFTNAWNFVAMPLSYFKNEYGLDIKMIGVWGNSVFNQHSPMYSRFKRKNKKWGREFELSLFKSYNFNCFLCQEHLDLFKRKYQTIGKNSQYAVTGYPFEYLKKNVINEDKENTIIFPYEIVDNLEVGVFKNLQYELPEYQFSIAREYCNSRLHYVKFLRKSKALFCARRFEYDPVLIWEAMLNGVYPILPKLGIFEELFPEKYTYPKELVVPRNNKYLYVLRTRFQLKEIVKQVIERFDSNLQELYADADRIGSKYYSNQPFTEILKSLW